MLPPTIFLGMTLPLVSKITSNKLKVLGRKIGGVFAINTAGNILGALAAGLLLISILGLKYTLEVGIVINLLVGVVIVFTDKTFSFKKTFVLVFACYLVFFGYKMIVPDWNKALFTQQIFRKMDRRETYEDYSERMRIAKDRVLFYKDGVDATVSVFRWPGSLSLYVNGKADASTSGGDLSTQVMLAQLPLTLKPQATDLLVVGLGSGITCGSALLHPIKNLDLVEICQTVVDANIHFTSYNNNALEDERLHLYVEDAKTFLQKSKKKYDVIISEPSNPWMSGIASLFSIEFFEECARHIKDDGLMIQWVQGYEIDNETFELVLRTFHSIFPEIQIWIAGSTDVLLVGSKTKIEPDLNESEKRIAQDQIKDDLSRIGVNDLFTLLNMQITSPESLRSSIKMTGRVHSDYNPILDYRAPMVLYTDSSLRLTQIVLDERRNTLADGNLLLDAYLKDHKIDYNNLRNLYRHFSKYETSNKTLIIPLAVKWYREYPEDENATLAYASHNIDSLEGSIRLFEKLIVEDKKLEYLDAYANSVVKKYKVLRASFFPEALSDAIEKLEMCISLSKDKKATFYYFAGKIHIDRMDYERALYYI
jgi:spermidine synthase